METTNTIQRDLWLIKIDEREHWCAAIKARTTANFGVYAFDRAERTFCCELTPSYCLVHIANDYSEIEGLTEEQRDALNGEVLEENDDEVRYFHVSFIEALIKAHPERAKKVELELDEDERDDWNKTFDRIAEEWGTGALMF